MPFSQRNIFYLRTSAHVVLRTILYLDPRDVKWMNSHAFDDDANDADGDGSDDEMQSSQVTGDLVWARALSKLKNKIMPKLRAESIEGDILSTTNKKEKVDVHIEPDFQMAYFFRKVSGRHAVLLKHKELRFPKGQKMGKNGTTNGEMPPPALPASAIRRSDAADSMPASRLARREENNLENVLMQQDQIANGQAIQTDLDMNSLKRKRPSDGLIGMIDLPSSSDLSMQGITVKQEEDDDIQLLDSMPLAPVEEDLAEEVEAVEEAAAVEEEEDDKKPRLHVDYSGFKIFGKCFIVVIEPTKRTKRLRSGLFQTEKAIEVHQLSATPVPRQARETPIPSAIQSLPNTRRSALMQIADQDESREDSRRDRFGNGLFRGTPSDYTPTPTPEPESHSLSYLSRRQALPDDMAEDEDNDDDDNTSHSMMLATQMLEGGMSGSGNDIDDD